MSTLLALLLSAILIALVVLIALLGVVGLLLVDTQRLVRRELLAAVVALDTISARLEDPP